MDFDCILFSLLLSFHLAMAYCFVVVCCLLAGLFDEAIVLQSGLLCPAVE